MGWNNAEYTPNTVERSHASGGPDSTSHPMPGGDKWPINVPFVELPLYTEPEDYNNLQAMVEDVGGRCGGNVFGDGTYVLVLYDGNVGLMKVG